MTKPRGSAVREIRTFELGDLRIQTRAEGDEGAAPKIGGYAAVFNRLSEPIADFLGYEFKEEIAPGAFAKTLKEADVRALWNHDANYVLGRNKSGTLSLREDDHGLAFDVTPPDTTWARDLMESMKRGDVTQCSFAFRVIKDKWTSERDKETGKRTDIRTLLEVRLYDVSVVTYPAYSDTDASVRSLAGTFRGAPAEAIADLIASLRGYLPDEPVAEAVARSEDREDAPAADHSPEAQPEPPVPAGHSIAWRQVELDLLLADIDI